MSETAPLALPPDSSLDPMTRSRVTALIFATLVFALFRIWARAHSLWDWDEALFSLSLRDFDVIRHHPHPPGFPLYVAAARIVGLVVPGEFEALRAVNLIAGALLFPLSWLVAREAGFGFTTSMAGAALLCTFPNVVLFGAGAFSDVPSLALMLAAIALLLRGRSSPKALVAGMALAGAASSIRIQNVLVCAIPALLAMASCWKASRRAVICGLSIAATIVAVSYGGAAVASGSWAGYIDVVREHADYIARVDSWRVPERPPLADVAERVFVRPFRAASLPGIVSSLALLALIDLAVNRHRPTAIVAATFLPMMLFALLMLDWHSMPRFAIAWMPLHAILAARGAEIAATMVRSWLRTPVTEVQWLFLAPLAFAMVARTLPALEIVRTTDSPAIGAIREVAQSRDAAKTRVWVTEGSTSAMAWLELRGFDVVSLQSVDDVPLSREEGRDAILIAEGDLYGAAKVFRRNRKPFLGVERERYFEVSIVPVESTVRFGDGWFEPDEVIAPARRWMGASSRMVVGASRRDRVARLHVRVPRVTSGSCNVEVMRDGVIVATLKPVELEFNIDVAVAASEVPHEIRIRVDRTFRPAESEPGSTDTRELGLRLLGLELR